MKPISKRKRKWEADLAFGMLFPERRLPSPEERLRSRDSEQHFYHTRALGGQNWSLGTTREVPQCIDCLGTTNWDAIQIISVLTGSEHIFSGERDDLMIGLTSFLPLFTCSDHAQSEIGLHGDKTNDCKAREITEKQIYRQSRECSFPEDFLRTMLNMVKRMKDRIENFIRPVNYKKKEPNWNPITEKYKWGKKFNG